MGGICARVGASLEEADGRGPPRRAALDRRRRDRLQQGPQVLDRGGRPRPRKGRAGLRRARQAPAQRLPRPAHGGAARRQRGHRRRRAPDRRRGRGEGPRRRARRGPLPRRLPGDRRPRRAETPLVCVEGGRVEARAQAPPRAPAQGRAGPSRPGRAGEGPRGSRCSRTPRTSRRGRPRRSRGSRRPARRCGAATCPRKGCGLCSGPAPSARRASSTAGSPGRAGAGYRSSSSSPESQAQARRDPALHRARRLQRPRGGREQQDKGRDQAGLRLQEHGRPDRPHHAQVLGPEAGAAGEGGFVIPTHTNSRSLVNIADLFHRPWRVSF